MKPEVIKTLRRSLGMTQVKFAKALGVSFATVNRWERGHCVPLSDRLGFLRSLRLRTKELCGVTDKGYHFSRCGNRAIVRLAKKDWQNFETVFFLTKKDLRKMLAVLI